MSKDSLLILRSYSLNLRTPDTATLHRLQADPAFDWRDKVANFDWWKNILEGLRHFLERLFGHLPPDFKIGPYWDAFTYIVITIAAILVILKLLNTNLRGLFFRSSSKGKGPGYELMDENINDIDFERDIEEAVRQKLYRKAIRLYYLKSLKVLSDKHLIDWQIDKTNRDYRRELKNSVIAEPFAELTLLFDYIWYGEFAIDERSFLSAKENFTAFEKRILG